MVLGNISVISCIVLFLRQMTIICWIIYTKTLRDLLGMLKKYYKVFLGRQILKLGFFGYKIWTNYSKNVKSYIFFLDLTFWNDWNIESNTDTMPFVKKAVAALLVNTSKWLLPDVPEVLPICNGFCDVSMFCPPLTTWSRTSNIQMLMPEYANVYLRAGL